MCRDAKALLLVSTLFTFAMGLSNIFVNIFFWKQTNNFNVIVLYNFTHYLVIPITFIIGGILSKRRNGIWSLRLGLLAYAMFFTLILFIGSRGVLYIYLLGVIHGIGSGFYWLAFNTLSFDFTEVTNRDTFNGYNGSCSGVAAAAAPMTAAYIISLFEDNKGYSIVFTMTLAIFVLLVLISLTLKCKDYGGRLNFRKAFSRNCEEWGIIRWSTALWGVRDVIIVFVVNILIIETTKSELSLGKLTLMGSLLSSASYVLVQRIIKPPKRRLSILIGALGAFLAVVGLAIRVKYTTLLMYVAMDAFFLPFFLIQLSSSTYNVINHAHDENMRIEYMINKDLVLNGGRIVSSIILLILLNMVRNLSVLQVYLLFLGLAPIASGYFLAKLRKVLSGDCD
ncbi:MAG: Major Facilitator Superfamily transporter [Clostridia bacterium]|jgi:YQGE family putative transporter|nr:Major Facilitator Superfamily transporter [Clostridia bacterium]